MTKPVQNDIVEVIYSILKEVFPKDEVKKISPTVPSERSYYFFVNNAVVASYHAAATPLVYLFDTLSNKTIDYITASLNIIFQNISIIIARKTNDVPHNKKIL